MSISPRPTETDVDVDVVTVPTESGSSVVPSPRNSDVIPADLRIRAAASCPSLGDSDVKQVDLDAELRREQSSASSSRQRSSGIATETKNRVGGHLGRVGSGIVSGAAGVTGGVTGAVTGAVHQFGAYAAKTKNSMMSEAELFAKVVSDIDFCRAVLDSPALVGMLVDPGFLEKEKCPEDVQIVSRVSVTFCDSECDLMVLRLRDAGQLAPCLQLKKLGDQLHPASKEFRVDGGPWLWCYKPRLLCRAVLAMDSLHKQDSFYSCIREFLNNARILRSDQCNVFYLELQKRFGRSVAYSFAWSHYYTQCLWILAIFCFLWACLGVSPSEEGKIREGSDRIAWEIAKALVAVWSFCVVIVGWNVNNVLDIEDEAGNPIVSTKNYFAQDETKILNPDYKEGRHQEGQTWTKMLLIALPLLLLFQGLVMFTMMSWIMLTLYMAYVWGDCVEISKYRECRGPDVKHGFLGVLADIGADILLALLFELLYAICGALAQLVVSFRNYELLENVTYAESMLVAILDGVERVSAFGLLAFIFVPRWSDDEDICDPHKTTYDCDCSDVFLYSLFGNSALGCLQRRLHITDRRIRFEKALKGPFVVAPFVVIIVKVLSPLLARYLNRCARDAHCCGLLCCRFCCSIWRPVTRILGLIFYFDGDGVGGICFVAKGWPYGEIEAEKVEIIDENASEILFVRESKTSLTTALHEATKKEFEPTGELLELKLNLLLVSCFAPVMPIGAITTLIGWWLDGRFDLIKLLNVRRTSFPTDVDVLHKTHRMFTLCAAFASFTFSIGLSLLTYHEDADQHKVVLGLVMMPVIISLIVSFKPSVPLPLRGASKPKNSKRSAKVTPYSSEDSPETDPVLVEHPPTPLSLA